MTPGDVYEEGIREDVTQGREFIGSTVAGSMPQALQSRQPLLRSLQIANLSETCPVPPPHPPPLSQPSSPPALPPSTPIPLERTEQEQNDDPEQRGSAWCG